MCSEIVQFLVWHFFAVCYYFATSIIICLKLTWVSSRLTCCRWLCSRASSSRSACSCAARYRSISVLSYLLSREDGGLWERNRLSSSSFSFSSVSSLAILFRSSRFSFTKCSSISISYFSYFSGRSYDLLLMFDVVFVAWRSRWLFSTSNCWI